MGRDAVKEPRGGFNFKSYRNNLNAVTLLACLMMKILCEETE
jgi:hypothetical protein